MDKVEIITVFAVACLALVIGVLHLIKGELQMNQAERIEYIGRLMVMSSQDLAAERKSVQDAVRASEQSAKVDVTESQKMAIIERELRVRRISALARKQGSKGESSGNK